MAFNICSECYQKYHEHWCKPCHSKHFRNNFNNWTSGNDKINKFIQDAQLNANKNREVIEWIPYDRFENVKQIGRGGFGTIHYARWIDGPIREWDIENQQWKRDCQEVEVVLKKFDNFVNLNEDFLNEMIIHLKTDDISIKFHGITQDPEVHEYMMVLKYAADGNLREYLKINFNNINWFQKLAYLWALSLLLMSIHELDIVHQDFHPGNILSYDFENFLYISDFGLSKLIGANPNNPEKKNIFGVLPYIAPEVLSGEKEYTKAADVYSFGIIAYEIVTGFPPYPYIPHDKDLAMKICNGLRPKIPFHTPKLITRMIMRCWDARVTHRPTFEELYTDGNLREYLKINFNNINWFQKLAYLWALSLLLMSIHELDIVHQDFHPGNILSYDFENFLYISDFGLSKLIGANPNNPEKKNIFGVLPYIAPEVLSGEKEYTKAADVYSFGIIAYEIVTGFPPYPYIPHDKDLAMKICNGLRPKIPFHTPKLITRMIMRCWDARVTHRPTFEELYSESGRHYWGYRDYLKEEKNIDSEIVIQIKKAEEFSTIQESANTTTPLNYQTHPQAIYTSRLLNYSSLPEPKNEENFERELEELTKSMFPRIEYEFFIRFV
ncbi:hypothetical protein Glove_23g130 [Diversispora epigaea]|uniref:Protein kinase domain-containing protein n=1 Tax=Diversispora epigaea TaxID=1348612 RepID=A0A397JVH6_9GLOM|nr:hypothetical protein Glove_23g130 [Diversispora epigaea]